MSWLPAFCEKSSSLVMLPGKLTRPDASLRSSNRKANYEASFRVQLSDQVARKVVWHFASKLSSKLPAIEVQGTMNSARAVY